MDLEAEMESNIEGDLPYEPDRDLSQYSEQPIKKSTGKDLIARIADVADCSRLQAGRGLNVTLDSIMDLTIASRNFTMMGVGAWTIKESPNRHNFPAVIQAQDSSLQPKYRVGFSSSPLMNKLMNDPLNKHSQQLASFKEEKECNRFNWVSSVTESDMHIFERVVTNNKSSSADLYELMKCRGMMTESISRNFLKNLQIALRELLLEHRQIMISGFGSFYLKECEGRIFTIPSSGKEMFIPPHRRVKFSAGLDFKRRLNPSQY